MTVFSIPISIVVFLCCCQTNEWNNIVPLKSSLSDVEKLLGKPVSGESSYVKTYSAKESKVYVTYSTGMCDSRLNNGWNVAASIVIGIDVYPKIKPNIGSVKLDGHKWKSEPDRGLINHVNWINEEDGILILADSVSGEIAHFTYFPRRKYEHMKCNKKE